MKKHLAFRENPYFLQNAHYTCVTLYCDAGNANVRPKDGQDILPAGTIWPDNNSGTNAIGIVYRDVVIPDGAPGVNFSCLTHGYINKHYFPVGTISATLPETIQFIDGEIGSVSSTLGYFIIDCAAPQSITAGSIAAATTYTVTLSLDSIGGAGYEFNTSANVSDFVISNSVYPVQISAATVSSSSVSLTILVTKGFHAHTGDKITVTAKANALVDPNGNPSVLDSNTVVVAEVV